MTKQRKKWEELTFKDHFIFERVMQNPELCQSFLSHVFARGVSPLAFPPQTEAVIDTHYDAKSIRLDVIAHEANGAVHDIELQNTGSEPLYLGLRVRYYKATIDRELLQKGQQYKQLAEVSIIFICDFDPFGEGFRRYTFRKRCDQKLSLVMPDRSVEIFLNIHGTIGDESPELLSMFDYMAIGRVHSDFAAALDAEVQKIKADEEQRSRYMSLTMLMEDAHDDGYAEGKDDGYAAGKIEERRDIAQRLLQFGLPLAQIAAGTGLTVDQVQELQSQQA